MGVTIAVGLGLMVKIAFRAQCLALISSIAFVGGASAQTPNPQLLAMLVGTLTPQPPTSLEAPPGLLPVAGPPLTYQPPSASNPPVVLPPPSYEPPKQAQVSPS
jgi:hypothetical protein